jgi:beta-mannosidase
VFSDWESIPRLTFLQLLFAPQPYFGRELRYFNQAPWWYRLEFATPADIRSATLRFDGVDYFAKVWLNGKELGEHEGYADPFEYEVGALLERGRSNVLVVKVSSPWDTQVAEGQHERRFWTVIRQLLKGSYEHADTFVQRDVNPVGIWRPVQLIPHDGLHSGVDPAIETTLASDRAVMRVNWPVALAGAARDVVLVARFIAEPNGEEVARVSRPYRLAPETPLLRRKQR